MLDCEAGISVTKIKNVTELKIPGDVEYGVVGT